jgi:peptidylprolyl isomerase
VRLALAAALALAVLAGCASSPPPPTPHAAQTFTCPAAQPGTLELNTTQGCFAITLRPDAAPKTVAHIVALAKQGFYDGIPFHRYAAGFVIQGGDPNCKNGGYLDPSASGCGRGGSGTTVPFENNTLQHDYGAVGLARSESLDSGDSQFYVILPTDGYHSLDGHYVVFGRVTDMSVPLKLRVGDVMVHVTAG